MQNIFIVVVQTKHFDFDLEHFAKRNRNGFTIVKVKGVRESFNNYIDIQIRPISLSYKAEFIYDINKQQFYKNRYDISGCNSATMLPNDIKPLFEAIIDVVSLMSIEELKSKYKKSNLIEAIYLTDTYKDFCDVIDPIDYQLVRYKYGKEMPKGFIPELVERYPEKVI